MIRGHTSSIQRGDRAAWKNSLSTDMNNGLRLSTRLRCARCPKQSSNTSFVRSPACCKLIFRLSQSRSTSASQITQQCSVPWSFNTIQIALTLRQRERVALFACPVGFYNVTLPGYQSNSIRALGSQGVGCPGPAFAFASAPSWPCPLKTGRSFGKRVCGVAGTSKSSMGRPTGCSM